MVSCAFGNSLTLPLAFLSALLSGVVTVLNACLHGIDSKTALGPGLTHLHTLKPAWLGRASARTRCGLCGSHCACLGADDVGCRPSLPKRTRASITCTTWACR